MDHKKNNLAIIYVLGLLILTTGAIAYPNTPYYNYGHSAFWNESAECPGSLCSIWNSGSGMIQQNTTQVWNGTYSAKPDGVDPYSYTDTGATGDYNFTGFFYYPDSNPMTATTWGMRNTPGQCGGDGSGVCIGTRAVTSGTHFVTLIDNNWAATTVPLSAGWHSMEWRVTGNTTYEVYIDGVLVVGGNSPNMGGIFNYLFNTGNEIYFDDLHAWNGTANITPPTPPANTPPVIQTVSVSVTSNNSTLIINANVTDADNSTVLLVTSLNSSGVITQLPNTTVNVGTLTNYRNTTLSVNGTYSVCVYATDYTNNSNTLCSNAVSVTFPATPPTPPTPPNNDINGALTVLIALFAMGVLLGFGYTMTSDKTYRQYIIYGVGLLGVVAVVTLLFLL